MKTQSSGTIIGYFLAIFLVGLALGGAIGYSLAKKPVSRFPTPLEFETGWLSRYQSELSLSDEQLKEIQPLLPEAVEELGTIWFRSIMTMGAVHERVNRDIERLLDDQQREKLVQWIKKGRERRLRLARGKPNGNAGQDIDIWGAAQNGNIDAINRHLADGIDINKLELGFGLTPLHMATMHDQYGAVDLLLKKGAEVNARSWDGNTALHGAAFFGRVKIAQLLVQNGGDINAGNDKGETPLNTLIADWRLTRFLGDILQVELDQEKVTQGREEIAKLFSPPGESLDFLKKQ